MKNPATALGAGLVAAVGFYFLWRNFQCCNGESGFDQNVIYSEATAAVLLLVALVLQLVWRRRPFIYLLTVLAWFGPVCGIILLARPSWDDYILGKSLHLGFRAAGVFAFASAAGFILARPRRI